jgi:hypothetical protein
MSCRITFSNVDFGSKHSGQWMIAIGFRIQIDVTLYMSTNFIHNDTRWSSQCPCPMIMLTMTNMLADSCSMHQMKDVALIAVCHNSPMRMTIIIVHFVPTGILPWGILKQGCQVQLRSQVFHNAIEKGVVAVAVDCG